jgi:4-hydroxy 2-oxovalerate aldolase
MSGIYSSHPNNVTYLTEMHKLRTKDIKNILSMIKPELRKRYDYDNIDHLYLKYFSSDFDDTANLEILRAALKGRKIFLIIFGATLNNYGEEVRQAFEKERPIVICINHIYDKLPLDYVFYGNQRRYHYNLNIVTKARFIITSNFDSERENDIIVSYNKLLSLGYKNFDNTVIMCLNLLKNINIEKIMLAGFDGYSRNTDETYFDEKYSHYSNLEEYEQINRSLEDMLKNFAADLRGKIPIEFITPSRFEHIFK